MESHSALDVGDPYNFFSRFAPPERDLEQGHNARSQYTGGGNYRPTGRVASSLPHGRPSDLHRPVRRPPIRTIVAITPQHQLEQLELQIRP